jgi:hypothetical protein
VVPMGDAGSPCGLKVRGAQRARGAGFGRVYGSRRLCHVGPVPGRRGLAARGVVYIQSKLPGSREAEWTVGSRVLPPLFSSCVCDVLVRCV